MLSLHGTPLVLFWSSSLCTKPRKVNERKHTIFVFLGYLNSLNIYFPANANKSSFFMAAKNEKTYTMTGGRQTIPAATELNMEVSQKTKNKFCLIQPHIIYLKSTG